MSFLNEGKKYVHMQSDKKLNRNTKSLVFSNTDLIQNLSNLISRYE